MVKCAECGFLSQHVYQGNVPKGFIDVEESPRENGELPGQPPVFGGFRSLSEPDLTPEKMSGDSYPTCFMRVAPLKNETVARYAELATTEPTYNITVDAVKDVIHRDRECNQFVKWERGFTPKEHKEMIGEKRKSEQQEKRKTSDRVWHFIELGITLVVGAIIAIVAARITKG